MQTIYNVAAHWDPEAAVWYSKSDIPGLVIEAETIVEFEQRVNALAPEMLSANGIVFDASDVIEVRVNKPSAPSLSPAFRA